MSLAEFLCLCHRYAYYCMQFPIISDQHYDKLEKLARSLAPSDSPVHGLGSDRESDYPDNVRAAAKQESGEIKSQTMNLLAHF